MFPRRISVYLCFASILCPKLSVAQFSAQILSQNARIQRLCSEMSTTCARSCQAYIGHCNLNVGIPPPIADMVQMTSPPQVPVPEPTLSSPNVQMPATGALPPPTIEARCWRQWAHRENFLQSLCSEMSTTCARNCQTFIEQCNLPSSGGSPSQDGLTQVNPPVADAPPQQQQPGTIVPIINPTATSKPAASQQNCKGYNSSCVDHRDCCDFLYCRRFTHPTGAEAKLGYCEHDPAKF